MPRVFSSKGVADIVGADPSSVNRWIDSGQLKAYRTPGGHRRVGTKELVEFLERCGITVPQQLGSGARQVLLVDGDATAVRSLQRSLQRVDSNLVVQACSCGIEALLKVALVRPTVVVLEASISGLDGATICERIKSEPDLAHVAIIAVMAKSGARQARRLVNAGADVVVTKPLRAANLVQEIEAIAGSNGVRVVNV